MVWHQQYQYDHMHVIFYENEKKNNKNDFSIKEGHNLPVLHIDICFYGRFLNEKKILYFQL